MLIDKLEKAVGPNIYYDPGFRNELEDHITYFKENKGNSLTIIPFHAVKYQGDFFGLLDEYKVPSEYHWLIMRMNNFTSPTDCGDTIDTVIVPNYTLVERIRSGYVTQNKIKM